MLFFHPLKSFEVTKNSIRRKNGSTAHLGLGPIISIKKKNGQIIFPFYRVLKFPFYRTYTKLVIVIAQG